MKAFNIGFMRILYLAGLAGLLSFLAPQLRADDGDPPTRVARISYLDGSVSFQPSGTEDWGTATRNRPMTIGDRIWSDQDSRVELQAGQAAIHLGSMTALSFLNLDENTTQMRLAEGTINFRVRELRGGELYEVDTPNLAFTLKSAGAFRLDVNENGDSTAVTVFRGEGEVTAGGKTFEVKEGERAEFNGTDTIENSIGAAQGTDGFDQWATERDQKEDRSPSAQYVSRDTVGYGDLDDYGDWRDDPEYGHVWYPRSVAADWAPYSSGYWSYVGPWGWTWVDYAPWGFAPFHYGRWAYTGGGWGWCPGPIYSRPIYGPAFVGFIGGRNWNVGFGFGGGIGWFPLGWGEPFHPWYHSSNRYFTNVNIHNTFFRNRDFGRNGDFHNRNYAYARNTRAVTLASRNAFVNGERINRGAFRVNSASFRGAEVSNRAGFNPTNRSYVGADNMRGRISRPSSAVQNRQVMARNAPSRGASRMPVRTFNQGSLQAGRFDRSAQPGSFRNGGERPAGGRTPNSAGGFGNRPGTTFGNQRNSGVNGRQQQLSHDRPPSARFGNSSGPNPGSQRANPRSWEAQGNSTDRGRGPAGFGRSSGSPSEPARNTRMRSDRPPQAGAMDRNMDRGASGTRPFAGDRGSRPSSSDRGSFGGNSGRSYQPPQRGSQDRPSVDRGGQGGRSYQPPDRSSRSMPSYRGDSGRSYSAPRSYGPSQRSYPAPSRNYSAPSRNYSAPSRNYSAPSRSYSAPSRSYSAPSRSYSAPSRSYSAPSHGGGGGGSRGGGGSAPRGGGGSSHTRH